MDCMSESFIETESKVKNQIQAYSKHEMNKAYMEFKLPNGDNILIFPNYRLLWTCNEGTIPCNIEEFKKYAWGDDSPQDSKDVYFCILSYIQKSGNNNNANKKCMVLQYQMSSNIQTIVMCQFSPKTNGRFIYHLMQNFPVSVEKSSVEYERPIYKLPKEIKLLIWTKRTDRFLSKGGLIRLTKDGLDTVKLLEDEKAYENIIQYDNIDNNCEIENKNLIIPNTTLAKMISRISCCLKFQYLEKNNPEDPNCVPTDIYMCYNENKFRCQVVLKRVRYRMVESCKAKQDLPSSD